jgi:hypothetical protein
VGAAAESGFEAAVHELEAKGAKLKETPGCIGDAAAAELPADEGTNGLVVNVPNGFEAKGAKLEVNAA